MLKDLHKNASKRKKLVKILEKEGSKISEEDFEGAKLISPIQIAYKLKQKYGFASFPIIIMVPKVKWDGDKGLARKLKIKGFSGVNIPRSTLPGAFNKIDLAFISSDDKKAGYHEALHATQNIYNPREDNAEHYILGEIFAELITAKKPADWFSNNTYGWNDWIDFYGKKLEKKEKQQLKRKLRKSLESIAFLHLKMRPSIVAQILLNSRSLEELASWSRTELRRYNSADAERRLELKFCRDAAREYKEYRDMTKERIVKKLSKYNFSEIGVANIMNIASQVYREK